MKRPFLLLAVFAAAVLSAPAQPDALATARKAYSTAVEKATAPLRVDYLRTLDRLLQEYTRAGKLDEAVAVKSELFRTKMAGKWEMRDGAETVQIVFGTVGTGWNEKWGAFTWALDGDAVQTSAKSGWAFRFQPSGESVKAWATLNGKEHHEVRLRREG